MVLGCLITDTSSWGPPRSRTDLHSCTLVNRGWRSASQPVLFRSINLILPQAVETRWQSEKLPDDRFSPENLMSFAPKHSHLTDSIRNLKISPNEQFAQTEPPLSLLTFYHLIALLPALQLVWLHHLSPISVGFDPSAHDLRPAIHTLILDCAFPSDYKLTTQPAISDSQPVPESFTKLFQCFRTIKRLELRRSFRDECIASWGDDIAHETSSSDKTVVELSAIKPLFPELHITTLVIHAEIFPGFLQAMNGLGLSHSITSVEVGDTTLPPGGDILGQLSSSRTDMIQCLRLKCFATTLRWGAQPRKLIPLISNSP